MTSMLQGFPVRFNQVPDIKIKMKDNPAIKNAKPM
jgi:hypothetical protein